MTHEKFLFFKYPFVALNFIEALRDELLPSLTAAIWAKNVAPKSISLLNEASSVTFCVGYDEEDPYPVNFTVADIGSGSDGMVVLEGRMEALAAASGSVICHDIFTVDGSDVIYALMMML